MHALKVLGFILCLLVVSSCGDKQEEAKQVPNVPINSKAGWTQESIDVLIACQPYPGKMCECVIPKVTTKYTPEQVKEKSPYVAEDMLSIKAECGGSGDVTSSPQKTEENPTPIGITQWPYKMMNMQDTNCETGEHTYETLTLLCEGLQSTSLNNDCALETRTKAFEFARCPGTFHKKP